MLADILSVFERLLNDFDGMVHITVFCRNVVFFVQQLTDSCWRHLAIHIQIHLLYDCLVVQKVSVSDTKLMVVLHWGAIASDVTFLVRSPAELDFNRAILMMRSLDLYTLLNIHFLVTTLMALDLELDHLALGISLPVLLFELNLELYPKSIVSIQSFILISKLSREMRKVDVVLRACHNPRILENLSLNFVLRYNSLIRSLMLWWNVTT